LMGPRVPTIMVSPWVKEQSVFRADGDIPFDSTSFAATLLNWFGVPKPLWGLGDRMEIAPTFEAVLQASQLRKDAPTLTPPYDKSFPRGSNKT
ncbi:MAG: alkaline phosphatase family protein, partial [Chromatiales bacterium]|nr:alkaline phosphatase family protein [Chromatiales bacterium]